MGQVMAVTHVNVWKDGLAMIAARVSKTCPTIVIVSQHSVWLVSILSLRVITNEGEDGVLY